MTKQELIDQLNNDLAGELGAIIQYITYAAKVTGPYRPQLSQFFLAEVADEQLHAQFLANKIVALRGEPTTQPRPVPVPIPTGKCWKPSWPPNSRPPGIMLSGPNRPRSLGKKG